jgi:SAM-dependent methyltransferase
MIKKIPDAEFFEFLYLEDSDPWSFATNPYEQYRYKTIIEALNHRHYQRVFEPGCSIGVLTQYLATLCERVDALDISPTAVGTAARRCANLGNVVIRYASLAEALHGHTTNLVVLSEIGYYFEAWEWREYVRKILTYCAKPTTLLAAHWLGVSQDHLLSGDEVHEIINSLDGLVVEHQESHDGFRLDRWVYL